MSTNNLVELLVLGSILLVLIAIMNPLKGKWKLTLQVVVVIYIITISIYYLI